MIDRAFAQVDPIELPNSIPINSPNRLAGNIMDLAIAIFFFAAFLGIVYSGYMILTAGGDASKVAAGKKNLIWSIVGVVIVTLTFFILNFVNNLVRIPGL